MNSYGDSQKKEIAMETEALKQLGKQSFMNNLCDLIIKVNSYSY